ncbi:flagellar export chaperone FliS [bacterium]|nr:flagellar export chaperone FliS [bacterium]MBU1615770.1 flagellar export chaperone FliS [bacterium]
MSTNPYEQYRKAGISTASSGRLILMLYDGAVRFLKEAKNGLSEKKLDVANNNIIKAQNILTELMLSLNMDVGEIAQNLYSLYDFMNRELIKANAKKDEKPIDNVIKMLVELRSAWEVAVRETGEKIIKKDPEKKIPTLGDIVT